jgi:Small-conductance mechanosensitive channel
LNARILRESSTKGITHILKETANLNTAFKNIFTKVDWESLVQHWLGIIAQLVFLTVILLLINWIGKKIIKHIFNNGLSRAKNPIPQNKLDTVYTLILNIFRYVLLFFWIYSLLSAIGIPVGTLIAGAGIFSLAIGLGAQGFVSDMVNGFSYS